MFAFGAADGELGQNEAWRQVGKLLRLPPPSFPPRRLPPAAIAPGVARLEAVARRAPERSRVL